MSAMIERLESSQRSVGSRGKNSLEESDLGRMTTEIARKKGCDRGFFTVCWGEYERGEVCRCKEEARAALSQTQGEEAVYTQTDKD